MTSKWKMLVDQSSTQRCMSCYILIHSLYVKSKIRDRISGPSMTFKGLLRWVCAGGLEVVFEGARAHYFLPTGLEYCTSTGSPYSWDSYGWAKNTYCVGRNVAHPVGHVVCPLGRAAGSLSARLWTWLPHCASPFVCTQIRLGSLLSPLLPSSFDKSLFSLIFFVAVPLLLEVS